MFKIAYHPKAFLSRKRNVQRGLLSRTQIILTLEKDTSNAKKLAQETGLSYASVLYHLHLLEDENILTRKGKRSCIWKLTGAGQKRLTDTGSKK